MRVCAHARTHFFLTPPFRSQNRFNTATFLTAQFTYCRGLASVIDCYFPNRFGISKMRSNKKYILSWTLNVHVVFALTRCIRRRSCIYQHGTRHCLYFDWNIENLTLIQKCTAVFDLSVVKLNTYLFKNELLLLLILLFFRSRSSANDILKRIIVIVSEKFNCQQS